MKNEIDEILKYPIFFEPNRVWRLYKGGAMLDKFSGNAQSSDSFFPEEWIASTTVAQNDKNQQSEFEGLSSFVSPSGQRVFLRDVLEQFPNEILGTDDIGEDGVGILCKFIDSAIRLPIQCHPDIPFAQKYCNSNHGKTEMWIVIGKRAVNGVKPYVYMGFKPDIDKEKFKQAVREQDMETVTSCMHKFEVNESDVFFIPGKLPHAIGPGCFILEVQEPTDLVVQPEKYLDGVELSDYDMWQGLDPEIGLECFDYEHAYDRAETLKRFCPAEKIIEKTEDFVYSDIIDHSITEHFRVQKLQVNSSVNFKSPFPWYIAVVAEGEGLFRCGDKEFKLKKGDYYLMHNSVTKLSYEANKKLSIYLISK